jgi:hypothetical protein
MKFLKFEFLNEAEWLTVKDSLYEEGVLIPEITAIHEIGHICFESNEEGECIDLSTKYAVDMLLNEPVDSLDDYIVWPKPCGIHTFAGFEGEYLKAFCEVNPTSEYRVILDETISE